MKNYFYIFSCACAGFFTVCYNMRAFSKDMPELDMNGGSLSKDSQKIKVQVETKNRFGKFVLMRYIRRAI